MRALAPVLLLLFSSPGAAGQLDPTGTYEYRGRTVKSEGHTWGPYYGIIQVRKLRTGKIVLTLFVCKGEPSYNSGGFHDTLEFRNNRAVYRDPESDTSCTITLWFDAKGITVREKTADFNAGCGFGHAVVADGRYRKIASRPPVLVDALTGEKIK